MEKFLVNADPRARRARRFGGTFTTHLNVEKAQRVKASLRILGNFIVKRAWPPALVAVANGHRLSEAI